MISVINLYSCEKNEKPGVIDDPGKLRILRPEGVINNRFHDSNQ